MSEQVFQHVAKLASAVAFVIRGLRKGEIKSQPVFEMDREAENWEPISLEDYLTRVLKDCNIEVKIEEPKRKGKRK